MPRRRPTLSDIRWYVYAPWLIVALLAHLVVLLALYVWSPAIGPPDEPITTVAVSVGPNPYDAPPAPVAGEPEADETPREVPPADVEPADETLLEAASADELPPVGASAPSGSAADAPGGDGPPRPGGVYANRGGAGRAAALRRFGGGVETETAVEAGLAWLAAHQRADGAWDRLHFDDQCPKLDVCRETAVSWPGTDADPGVTGLVLLAFLGAGNTPVEGEYRQTVTGALRFLLSRQDARGSFGPPDRMQLYNTAIATLALAEAAAMTESAPLRSAVQRSVANLAHAQQRCGGWDYTVDVRTDRCDMSVSGWVVMALKAASAAGASIPPETVAGIVDLTLAHTTRDGTVYYANKGTGTVEDRAAGTMTLRFGPAMTAVGMVVREMLGARPDAPVMRMQADLLLSDLPDVRRLRGGDPSELHSEYYWYYGTLAMFNQGGQAWSRWNAAIRDALLSTQDRSLSGLGERRHSYGSWPAFGRGWGKWGRAGGRVYSTALAVLCLEVYYRYEPAFLAAEGLLDERGLRAGIVARSGSERELWAMTAADLPAHVAEPVLVDWLGDADARVRLRAGMALARYGSPLGRGVLEALRPVVTATEQAAIRETLDRLAALTFPRAYGEIVRVDADSSLVVFDTRGGATYVGQELWIVRGVGNAEPAAPPERAIATLRVTRRRPEQNLAAGNYKPAPGSTVGPRPGDVVAAGR